MNLFEWLKPRPKKAPLDAHQLKRLKRLSACAKLSDKPLRQQRWVVLDLETSGLNMNRDQVLSIGAVVIEDGAIDLGQQFERTLLRVDHKVSPAVLIQGLAPSAIAAGSEPVEALLDFMEFVGESPILGFHAPFDQHMLGRALKESLDYRLQHAFFDAAEIAPMLCEQANLRHAGLDDWTQFFGLHAEERHNASADALVTAELALILFSHARRQQIDSPVRLAESLGKWRRRKQSHSF
ncbi:DNA polymerase III subunit epsilon [Pseudomonas avellanae]|uniref:DNA polymerase III subunit epsilon n=2 Tax=Pseudomonas syringae group TaxID=136849 RepID=A0A261WJW3_9PSED|nr:3'-5' exonuclease [Pseudomonas syringae]OZI86415.1 DNA polymerase III subunit epsilon [Pseudomonas avellanae]ATV15827.1 3'-5' exonuclease [Pseudomonas syringae pv. actinidiae]NYS41162.1 3'-5' exonuclease [Pseudomonas syringae pv. actinidiae]PIN63051.1 3'-5' exonuclease [Pseudomonas syringae pv. actinidiae]GAO93233.1 exonuclease [Pseudomonas syringae pv. actinidiae]